MINKLKSQKGLTGADVLISLLIILTSISTIGMIFLNVKSISRLTDAKTGATRIATNILENINASYYDEIQNFDSTAEGAQQSIFNTKIPSRYAVQVIVEKPQDKLGNDVDEDIVKKVTLNVKHKNSPNSDAVIIHKVIERENVRECNSPNFSGKYITQIVGENTDYQFYNPEAITYDSKIICPIRLNTEDYSIVYGDDLADLWYSYSERQWARVIVFDNYNELKKYVDIENHTISNAEILNSSEKAFVWIPRFKIKEDENKLYFMYKDTDYAIKKSTDGINNNIIDLTEKALGDNWSIFFTETAEKNPPLGEWFPYDDIIKLKEDGVAEQNPIITALFNSTKYGPLFDI